jgi:hypothetical protein
MPGDRLGAPSRLILERRDGDLIIHQREIGSALRPLA